MMQKQTDNSHLRGKVDLRIESLKLISKKEINVLDAFGGDGIVWNEVKKRMPGITIKVLRIDKKADKKGLYLKGDNIKYLKSDKFDLQLFDIIDLDAYGSPFNQLEIVFKRKYTGIVHCTYIQSGMGNINKALLQKIGYTDKMLEKAPTLFTRQPFKKMLSYLSVNKVKEIFNYQVNDRKNYFYFILGKR